MQWNDEPCCQTFDDENCQRLADWVDAVEAIAEDPRARREWLWLHSGAREDWRTMAELERQDPQIRRRLAWALEALAEQRAPRQRRIVYMQLSEQCFARHARRLLSTPCDCADCALAAAG